MPYQIDKSKIKKFQKSDSLVTHSKERFNTQDPNSHTYAMPYMNSDNSDDQSTGDNNELNKR
jgi:hypothetical protein